MKIALTNNFLYLRGGAERVMFVDAEMLQQRQHQVSFFSRRHPKNVPSAYEELFPPYVDPLQESLWKKARHAPKMVYNGDTYRCFERFIQQEQPDLIHAHNIYGGLTTAICDVANKHRIPMVMTLHDYKLICPSYLMTNHGQVCEECRGRHFVACIKNRCHKDSLACSLIYSLESYYNRWLNKYGRVQYFLCPSQFIRQKMMAHGIDAHKLLYVPNAIAVDTFTPNFAAGPYALFVGRLSHEKGVATLLDAITATDIPLKIVGDGPLRSELEALTCAKGAQQRITFLGYKSGEELAALYQGAAFVVMPSNWYENAPMTVLEAFAYGKPVLGARIGGIPEMIEPGQTGQHFTHGDSDDLHTKLITMWSARSELPDMGRRARAIVETRFSPQAHADALLHVYTMLCQSPSAT